MALFERVRQDRRAEAVSIRGLSRPDRETIREWLAADLSAPRKQRHTVLCICQRLVDERGATVAEPTVRSLVARVRRELETGRAAVTVPQLPSTRCRGGGRLRPGQRLARRWADRALDVRNVALALGPGGPRLLPERRAGGVPGRPRPRL